MLYYYRRISFKTDIKEEKGNSGLKHALFRCVYISFQKEVVLMKKVLSLALCLLLMIGMLSAMPSAFADDMPPLPSNLSELVRQFCQENYEEYGCIPIAGGTIHTSDLEEGVSYTFWSAATLILDADRSIDMLCCAGNLTIEGTATLTVGKILAAGLLRVDSGTVLCPKKESLDDSVSLAENGLEGQGIEINGGRVECPTISSYNEMDVEVYGGSVKADLIFATYGYTQRGGDVKAGKISAKDYIFMYGGSLTAYELGSFDLEFYGGVTVFKDPIPELGTDVRIKFHFPQAITEPAGGKYLDGKFVDAEGNEAEQVRIESVSFDFPFTDVPAGAYYYKPVAWASYHHITGGVTDTLFAPKRTCTRAQALTFLWRSAGSPEPTTTNNPFTDVKPDKYYYKAVLWAAEKGIASGTGKTTFSPNATCTRAQAVTFLWRYVDSPIWSSNRVFQDVKPGKYYYNAVLWAADSRITAGTSTSTFSPNAACTRGEVVTFLFRFNDK